VYFREKREFRHAPGTHSANALFQEIFMLSRSVSTIRKFFVLGMFALVMTACSAPAPEDVVKDFYKAVADNRTEDAANFFSLKDVKGSDLTAVKAKIMMVVADFQSRIQKHGGLDSVTTTLVKKEGGTARVNVEIKYKDGKTEKQSMKLEDASGKWKIVMQ
jgi:hypothetical protein